MRSAVGKGKFCGAMSFPFCTPLHRCSWAGHLLTTPRGGGNPAFGCQEGCPPHNAARRKFLIETLLLRILWFEQDFLTHPSPVSPILAAASPSLSPRRSGTGRGRRRSRRCCLDRPRPVGLTFLKGGINVEIINMF